MQGIVRPEKNAILYLHRRYQVERLIALLLLLLLLPLGLLIALAIRLNSRGPVFFRQERPGRGDSTFQIVKFRTMTADRPATDIALTEERDPRVTTVGRVLRTTHLDELPQLLNVIRGEMSMIGPRPDPLIYTEEYERSYPPYRDRRVILPGMTGLGQVRVGYTHNLRGARRKLLYDLEYIRRASPRLDLQILWATIAQMITGRGVR